MRCGIYKIVTLWILINIAGIATANIVVIVVVSSSLSSSSSTLCCRIHITERKKKLACLLYSATINVEMRLVCNEIQSRTFTSDVSIFIFFMQTLCIPVLLLRFFHVYANIFLFSFMVPFPHFISITRLRDPIFCPLCSFLFFILLLFSLSFGIRLLLILRSYHSSEAFNGLVFFITRTNRFS